MVGVVLAGGTGSRLHPLTKVTNKHLLPIGDQPMIYYPLCCFLHTNISRVLIVTGTEHMGQIVQTLGSGYHNLKFTYKVQDEAGGIAQALSLAEDFANGDDLLVILGDNIFNWKSIEEVRAQTNMFNSLDCDASVFLKKVSDPERFGVAEIGENPFSFQVKKVVEKPKIPKTNLAVVGAYLYKSKVFNVIKTLKPSDRGELEITDVNQYYANRGSLTYCTLTGKWSDAGTFKSYYEANEIWKEAAITKELPRK